MNFIGQASQYSFGRSLRHLFAWGTENDSQRLRQALASRYGAKPRDVALYHSGRSALTQAIRATVPAGSVVVVPGLTCIAVIRAIRAAECEPLYVDIDPETLQYDFADLEKKLPEHASRGKNGGNRAKPLDNSDDVCYNGGIVAQNTLGLPLDMQQLEKIAAKYHFAIIEDLAHCAGRSYPDRRDIGTVGSAVALSFGKGKAIDTTCGGAVIIREHCGHRRGRCDGEKAQRDEEKERRDEESSDVQFSLDQPERRPKLSQRLRDRWYPVFGGISRLLWPVGLGKPFLAALIRMHWIERSADTELNTEVRLTHWQAKLALRQLDSLPSGPLREFSLVDDRATVLEQLERAGYAWTDIWYDTPVAPARYAEEAAFPAADCSRTVQISRQIVNIPTWYRPEKIAKARAIIAKHRLEGKHD